MERNNGAPASAGISLFKGNVAAFLPQHDKTGAAKSANEFATGDGRKVPAHAATSMLVR